LARFYGTPFYYYSNFLVFRYEGNSKFNVLIFDHTAIDIKYPRIEDCELEDEVDIIDLDDSTKSSRKCRNVGWKRIFWWVVFRRKGKSNPSSQNVESYKSFVHGRPARVICIDIIWWAFLQDLIVLSNICLNILISILDFLCSMCLRDLVSGIFVGVGLSLFRTLMGENGMPGAIPISVQASSAMCIGNGWIQFCSGNHIK
jgi:hypothetical protein